MYVEPPDPPRRQALLCDPPLCRSLTVTASFATVRPARSSATSSVHFRSLGVFGDFREFRRNKGCAFGSGITHRATRLFNVIRLVFWDLWPQQQAGLPPVYLASLGWSSRKVFHNVVLPVYLKSLGQSSGKGGATWKIWKILIILWDSMWRAIGFDKLIKV